MMNSEREMVDQSDKIIHRERMKIMGFWKKAKTADTPGTWEGTEKYGPVKLASVDFRDGQQSVIATRMRTEDMLPILEQMDDFGYECIEMWGGATFDSCIRYLNEDPWERLKAFKRVCKKTPLRMLLRGQNLLGYTPYPDDVVERFVTKTAEDGMDIFLIFDGLNDIRNCACAAKAALKAGKRVEGNIQFTSSPVHTVESFVQTAKDYVNIGATAVHLEDMGGMIDPTTAAKTEIVYGPSIKDWPKMPALTENLLLQVASVIRDEVTTTDELIPSGETASYRSNPYKISEFTLIRKDPQYVGRAKAAQEFEKARVAGDKEKAGTFYQVLKAVGVDTPVEELMKTTGIGSVLYAKRPGDGSAREYAASCQKVLGGLANICIEYATKRYRSNCVNWGILPFTCPEKEIVLEPGEYLYLPGIRKAVEDGATRFTAKVIGKDGAVRDLTLELNGVTEAEKKVLLAGSLINSYKEA